MTFSAAAPSADGSAGVSAFFPVLELDRVSKSYPGTPGALRDVSLTVHGGELIAITGPSGSGKSTLVHLMAALDRPTTGEIRITGQPVARLGDRALAGLRAYRIGMVFQQFFLMDQLTAIENVATGLLYRGIPAAARRRAAAGLLCRIGLAHRMRHKAGQLSGGERQRVAIARAVVGEPAIVIADEPTGNLDSASGATVMRLLTQLNAEGTTVVIVTHDPAVAAAAHRQVTIRDGQVHPGTPAQPATAEGTP
ncbi:MAG TPA: ABC transporter ATP-binding protein [Trebonia sp.]|jgi:putative ABC transport system ATP-binding protein|nr:ABC transporter ATP-binding protein [Trebonia sp.]